MTDIAEMLQKTINLEYGTYDVRDNSVRIGVETLKAALAEIKRLRSVPNQFVGGPMYVWPHDPQWKPFDPNPILPPVPVIVYSGPLRPTTAHESNPDPWGSAFAMNTENWK